MKYVDRVLVAAILTVVSMSVPAYNPRTHERMSGEAVQRSQLAGPQSAALRALGFNAVPRFCRSIIAKPSPDWALADKGSVAFQNFSFVDGRGYLYGALTPAYKFERDRNFGLMFEPLAT